MEAYLDIETTGLSLWDNEITVVGIHLCNGEDTRFIQLIGKDIDADSILQALTGVEVIYTYNGSRFDLPCIYSRLGLNLKKFSHSVVNCFPKRSVYPGISKPSQHVCIYGFDLKA